jgi:hypothetical protein
VNAAVGSESHRTAKNRGATAIATRAEKLKTANPAQLNKQVEALRAAIKAG